MCVIELEPCEVWSEEKRRARKEHRCDTCQRRIRPGEEYHTFFSVWEGERAFQRQCAACRADAAVFADAHEEMISHPSYFPQLLTDCINEGDEESTRLWLPMLNAIRARRDAAMTPTRPMDPAGGGGR